MDVSIIAWADERYYWAPDTPNIKYCSVRLFNCSQTDFQYVSESECLPGVGTIVEVDSTKRKVYPLSENPNWCRIWDVLLRKILKIIESQPPLSIVLTNDLSPDFYEAFRSKLNEIIDVNSRERILRYLLDLQSVSSETKEFFKGVLESYKEIQKKRIAFLSQLKQASITFDIEGNQKGRTWEYAYKFGDVEKVVSHERTFSGRGLLNYLRPIDWADFHKAIQNRGIIIGHNIKEWDCKMILERFEVSPIVINHDKIWDTLEVEVLLHPERKYFGLNAENGHVAKNDVIAAEKLFWNQVAEILINKKIYDEVISALPTAFKKLVDEYQEYAFDAPMHSLLKPLTSPQEDILYTPSSIQRIIQDEDIKPGEKTLIIAPKEDWVEISRELESKVEFIYNKSSSSQLQEYNTLDLPRLSKLKDDKDIFKKALGSWAQKLMNSGRAMRFCDLPGLFRTRLTDAYLKTYILPISGASVIQCIEPDNLETTPWDPDRIILVHLNEFPKESSCKVDLFEFAISLDNYSEYTKTFPLEHEQAKLLVKEEFCVCFDYWLYQPYPKEIHLLYSFNVQDFKSFVAKNYQYASISEVPFQLSRDTRIIGCISDNNVYNKDNSLDEDNIYSYWSTQLAVFESIPTDIGPKVFILASDSEKEDLVKHYNTIKKKVFYTGEKHPYAVLDKLSENADRVGVMSLNDLLDGEKIVFPSGFTFVLNSLSFCDNLSSDVVRDTITYIYKRLSVYSTSTTPSILYIIDAKIINRCKINSERVKINATFSTICKESINENIIHRKPSLDEADFGALVEWIEETWAIPEHKEEVRDGVILEPQGRLYSIQKQAIKRVIGFQGKSNNTLLTIMPTGKGKSVIFQGPLMYKRFFKKSKRLSLVITPLQALMKNQVEELQLTLILNEVQSGSKVKYLFINFTKDKLKQIIGKLIKGETLPYDLNDQQTKKLTNLKKKYQRRIAYINSSTTTEQNKQILCAIRRGEMALLYIAPERLMYRSFYRFIEKVAFYQGLDSIIFDEAHCITGWGMEFRPDYVLAARKCKDIQRKHPEVSIQMFTATLPEQAKIDLFKLLPVDDCNILPKPETDDFISSLCPIREHIEIKFEQVQDSLQNNEKDTISEGKIMRVITLLGEEKLFNNLCNGNSRAIVFTKKRDDAEECARRLNEKFLNSSRYNKIYNKIDYFHAGRSKKLKEDIIKKFESGDILVLCSTKAFGLGMNIGNIHSVIHLTPPSFIEDYLQEVGRAGRNQSAFQKVFGESGRIQAICLYAPSDMERTVQQLQDEELKWEHIQIAFNRILDYKQLFGNKEDHTLVVPLNLSRFFHQCLGWLSDDNGLNRIKLLFRSPYSYQLKVIDETGILEGSQLYSLLSYISSIKDSNTIVDGIARVDANGVLEGTDNIHDINELEKVIGEGVALGVLSRDSMYVNVTLRKSIVDGVLRMKDNNDYIIPHLSFLCDLLHDEPSSDVLSRELSRIYQQIKENIPFFQGLSLIYSIDEIRDNCRQLLIAILDCGNNSITWSTVKKAVNAETDPTKAELFIMALSVLKLVNLGDTCSDYIEIEITNPEVIDDEKDKKTKEELERFNQNRILKNDSMYAMIDSYETSEKTKDFIREYSAKRDDELIGFEPASKYSARITLNNAIESGTLLNDEQRDIYNLPNDISISVSAGAGSGKTRLLIYRALKLILCQPGVDESEVLVLAYNRAVADEVCKRMDEYANGIHYVLRNKNIYTFHGFACSHLPQLLEQKIKFDEWETLLLDDILVHPSSYKKYRHILIDEFQDVTSTRLRIIRELIQINNATAFVIGDMSQSIYGYEKKADVKKRLFGGDLEFIRDFAIIKPNRQEEFNNILQIHNNRRNIWDGIKDYISIDPSDYHLIDTNTECPELKNNYRSYQAIVNTSVRWFEDSSLKAPKLSSQVHDSFEPSIDSCICPMPGNNWIKDLVDTILPAFLQNRETWEKGIKHDDHEINPFTTLCILFRTNSDVHDAYSTLKKFELPGSPEITIQGSDIFYQFTREFFFFSSFLYKLKTNAPDVIIMDDSFVAKYKNPKDPNDNDSVLNVAKQLALIIIKNNPGLTYSILYEEFVGITSEERNRLKEYVDEQLHSGDTKFRIVLSTIHRVKGMEYDAVVVPASTYPIDLDNDDLSADESNLEERRLMYVAFSRAKRMLYYYVGERERAILNNQQYEGVQNKFYAQDGLSAVDISFAAQNNDKLPYYMNVPDNSFFSIHEYIETNVHVNDKITLIRKDNSELRMWQQEHTPEQEPRPDEWCIYHDDNLIGNLSSKNSLRMRLNKTNYKKVGGLFVKSICVCKYNDQDQMPDGEGKRRKWCEAAEENGYVYYVDYYGCAEPLNDD